MKWDPDNMRMEIPELQTMVHVPQVMLAIDLAQDGSFDQAIECLDRYLETEAELSPLHRIMCLKVLVDWSSAGGEIASARRYASKATHLAMEELGPTHNLTLVTRNSLLYWQSLCGMEESSLKEFPVLVADSIRTYGRLHPLTIAIRNNSAMPLKVRGDYLAAARVYRSLLRDLTPEEPDMRKMYFLTWANLCESLSVAEKYDEAARSYEDLLTSLRKYDSDDASFIMSMRLDAARNEYARGNTAEAQQAFQQLLKDSEELLEGDDPVKFTILLHVLSSALDNGNVNEAREICERLVKMEEHGMPEGWWDELLDLLVSLGGSMTAATSAKPKDDVLPAAV